MLKDNPQSIISSAIKFASGTFLSRIGGLLRDMSMAFCFGTDPTLAAFLVAFRFANLFRRIFGESTLLNSFVPHFESFRNQDPKKGAQFFRDIFFSLTFLLTILIFVVEAGLVMGYLWGTEDKNNQEIISLTAIMFPGLLFICLFSLCSGLLQCEKGFFLTGVAPLFFNIVWIGSIWIYKDYSPQEAMIYLSFAITVAFIIQWLMTFPKTVSFMRRYLSWREIFQIHFFSPEICKMISSMSLGIIGVGAVQINSAIDTVFARYASLEGPAYLNYAIHLQQLPLALFGIGISSALLPPLSRSIQSPQLFNKLFLFAISSALLLLIPCTVAIFILGCPGINLIFGRGDFKQESLFQTTFCLWGYGIGLIPMGITLLLLPAFYAKKDYKTPTLASVGSLITNFILNFLLIFVFKFGAASLALSTSLSACFNMGFLFYNLSKSTDIQFSFAFFYSLLKLATCALVSGLITLLVEYAFFHEVTLWILFEGLENPMTQNLTDQILHFFIPSAAFIFSFAFLTWLLQINMKSDSLMQEV